MKHKRILSLIALALVALSLVACTKTSKNQSGSKESSAKSDELKMKDIDWSIDTNVIDGERYVLMNYTNNSPFVICEFEISFTEKDNITDDEKEKYYSEVAKAFDLSDKDLAQTKEEKIAMSTKTDKIAAVGESISNIYCYYYSGSYRVKDINHYNLVTPDIATIRYINGERIYTVNYDFISDKYNIDDETVKAYQWSTTDLGNHIPKPDVYVVESYDVDNESNFNFHAYGMSLDQFNTYVEECKKQGYSVNVSSSEGDYAADNKDKYHIDLYYFEGDNEMRGSIDAPEKK